MTIPPTHEFPAIGLAPNPATNPLVGITGQIVSAYIGNVALSADGVQELIRQTYGTLSTLGLAPVVEAPTQEPQPAVPVRKSITPDFIICLDDGKKFKSLKRHLKMLGMTPEDYRKKWGLPADYPMVAPNYSEQRSRLAKDTGLGTRR